MIHSLGEMSRIARVVAPGYPHHITQRGNRRQKTFFNDEDFKLYLHLMKEWCEKCGVEIWSYCLMQNHSHLVAVPQDEAGLGRAIGMAHWHYTRLINAREGWKGCLWQGRFASYVMDESYLCATVRYIEYNPVRAGIVKHPCEYPWSSVHSRLSGQADILSNPTQLNKISAFRGPLADWNFKKEEIDMIKKHSSTGRPLGGEGFISALEGKLERKLTKQRPGPKPGKTELSSVSL